MRVRDCMTREVAVVDPAHSVAAAARMMVETDVGSLPVQEDEKLVGMITDRDIVVRVVARELTADTPVREVMSTDVLYCFEDENVERIARSMGDHQVRRLPVIDRDKRLVGIISLADVAGATTARTTGHAVADISRRGGEHDQTIH